MDEKQAKDLVTKLVDAAYAVGKYSTNPDSLLAKDAAQKGAKLIDEVVYHLTSKSIGRDEAESFRCSKCGRDLRMPYCPNCETLRR